MATIETGDVIKITKTRDGWEYHVDAKAGGIIAHGASHTQTLDEALKRVRELVENA